VVVVVVVVVARYFRVNALPRWRPCGTLGQLAAPACARRAAIAAEACGVMYVHARDCRVRRPRGRIIGELRSPRFPAGEGKRGRSAHFKRASTATSFTRARAMMTSSETRLRGASLPLERDNFRMRGAEPRRDPVAVSFRGIADLSVAGD